MKNDVAIAQRMARDASSNDESLRITALFALVHSLEQRIENLEARLKKRPVKKIKCRKKKF